MGQQQLLLIVLGLLVVGIAVVVGIAIFTANAADAKRNNVTNELVNLASMAQQYYMKPRALAGGSYSFTGWTIPRSLVNTANGRYEADVYNDRVVIRGIGNEVVTGQDSVEVKITVYSEYFETVVVR